MIPFLFNVAQAYYKNFGAKVSRFTFVFPNRRAGLFFQKYLSQIAGKPIFSPEILTIADLFTRLSELNIADRIEHLFVLYRLYKDLSKSTETFDEFLYWGEMLLNDFDDIDKYVVDASQLFTNIQDIKEIDAGFSYLSEEQVIAIRRFWSNFIPIGKSERKKEFLEIWQILYELYDKFRTKLSEDGLAYEGMVFREIAEKAKRKEDMNLPFERLVFVGLNAHSTSEEIFLRYLQGLGIADFYWDYSSSLVKDANNRASYFIDRNRMLFPSQLPLLAEEIPMEKPIIEAIGIPSAVGQAKYVHSIIKELIEDKRIASSEHALNTAVILPDENHLLPVLYSIPEEIERINVTMGYSLNNSSISGLMDHIFDLQRNIRSLHDRPSYYFKFVLPILNHRYIAQILPEETKKLRQNILQYNKILVPVHELNIHPFLSLVFSPITDWKDIAFYLREILAYIERKLLSASLKEDQTSENYDTRSADMEREFIIEYYKTINKFESSLLKVDADMETETYFKLLKKLIAGISVPFSGEPLSGLQIMGVLETRAIDFENIIILSMNEGVFPKKRASNSFIPYNLRKGFGLPTYEHQDRIFAYHFYRLINRAKKIYLLYDTRTEGLQGGEVSRYFHQLKYLYPDMFDIREKLAVYEVSAGENLSISVRKSPKIEDKMKVFLTGERSLSASAINTYLDCPLQFYFSVVENMQEEDEIAETVEASTFGSIFHSVMEWLYRPFEGKMITADLLHKIAKDEELLTKTIELSFAKNYFKTETPKKLTGQNFLTGEVVKRYVKKVLHTDAGLTPFIYKESEKRIVREYILPSGKKVYLKGFIDRIDEVKGHTRIIDYKTGKGLLKFNELQELFDKDLKDRPKAVMQVFMYAYLYSMDTPGTILEPGIYYLRNLFDSHFNPDVEYRSQTGKSRVTDFSKLNEQFREFFDKCLEEIFDSEIPFNQTTTGKACEWCNFTSICKK